MTRLKATRDGILQAGNHPQNDHGLRDPSQNSSKTWRPYQGRWDPNNPGWRSATAIPSRSDNAVSSGSRKNGTRRNARFFDRMSKGEPSPYTPHLSGSQQAQVPHIQLQQPFNAPSATPQLDPNVNSFPVLPMNSNTSDTSNNTTMQLPFLPLHDILFMPPVILPHSTLMAILRMRRSRGFLSLNHTLRQEGAGKQ